METTTIATIALTSRAFENGADIPEKYTCNGDNLNPDLRIADLPEDTQSLALIMEDPDAPKGVFDHWLEWNIPVTDQIRENTNPGISGVNGTGKTGYHGPCPPSGVHRYFFHVYALDTALDLPGHSSREALENAMQDHILAKGTLMGRYGK